MRLCRVVVAPVCIAGAMTCLATRTRTRPCAHCRTPAHPRTPPTQVNPDGTSIDVVFKDQLQFDVWYTRRDRFRYRTSTPTNTAGLRPHHSSNHLRSGHPSPTLRNEWLQKICGRGNDQ